MAEVTQADKDAMARYPSLELCVQFSEDGQHIRKWSREPFDGGECLYVVSAQHFACHRTEAVKPLVEAPWYTPLGGLIEARQVCQDAYRRIEKAKSINGHIPDHPYDVALSALNSALGCLAVLVEGVQS